MSDDNTIARLMAMIAAYASYASRNATQQQAFMLHADIEAALREALDLGEPVAWGNDEGYQPIRERNDAHGFVIPLYRAPKAKP